MVAALRAGKHGGIRPFRIGRRARLGGCHGYADNPIH